MNPSNNVFDSILQTVKSYLSDQEIQIVTKAYQFSVKAHQEQLRAGGDPFITHPLAVTAILAELRMDAATLCAGLLHDVLEDTSVTADMLKAEFGQEILHLVQGVTKIHSIETETLESEAGISSPELIRQAENWRKMLIATAEDIRVIILKLADRKHNMETLEFLPPEKQKRIAEETLTLYAPLAHRLGMYPLKSSLEDNAFKYLEPEIYEELHKKLSEAVSQREEFLKKCQEKVQSILSAHAIPYRISVRHKNLNSIYRKMVRQNKPFEEIQDLAGMRIMTDTVEHCYALLGIIHSNFLPVPDTFTDYIAMPKNNLYQSLHTTIHIFGSEVIEIQIRTEEMHRISEYGVAAHWRYKQKGSQAGAPEKDSVDYRMDWIKHVMEWQQETKSPKEFLESLKVELAFDQVFVFTPKGDVIKLPAGSTPVDFAYAIHSDLGNQCVGAKVDGKMARLDMPLKSGSRCEIQIRKGQHPHKDWLEFVKTPRARSRIRKFLRENQ